ncbi:MAG TPA: hypothetical protein VGK38_01240, partial [Prolixibacteraceae bacterium]
MNKLILICIALSVTVSSFSQKSMKSLLNGKNLKGWDTYIGPKEKGGVPLGLNIDPQNIFTVQ